MHFKNGREAKPFDPVVCTNYDGAIIVGHIFNLRAAASCNCDVSTIVPGGTAVLTCQDVGKMYHAADAFAAVDLPGTVARPVSEPAAAPVVPPNVAAETPVAAAPATPAVPCATCGGSGVVSMFKDPGQGGPGQTETCQTCFGKGVQP